MTRRLLVAGAWLWITALTTPAAAAQPIEPLETRELRQRIEAAYRVVAVRQGIVLVPIRPRDEIGAIEITNGTVAVDGVIVTGSELERRLGADAALIAQLTYLTPARRLGLFDLDRVAVSPAAGDPPIGADPPAADPPVEPEQPAASDRSRGRRQRRGGLLRIGRDASVEAHEILGGDLVVVGGSATIAGTIDGGVLAIGGDVRLREGANVDGDVITVAGIVDREAGAFVRGDVNEIGWPPIRIHMRPVWSWWRTPWGGPPWGFVAPLALASAVIRLALVALLAAFVLMVGSRQVSGVERRVVAEPGKAVLVGFITELLFLPALLFVTIVLAVSIIGIPLLIVIPLAVVALGAAFVFGFTAVLCRLGSWSPFGRGLSPHGRLLIGLIYVFALTLLARAAAVVGGPLWVASWLAAGIGLIVEAFGWTLGLGAAILAWIDRDRAPLPVGPARPPSQAPGVPAALSGEVV